MERRRNYFNSQRLLYFDEVKYVAFVFLESEEKMKESKNIIFGRVNQNTIGGNIANCRI